MFTIHQYYKWRGKRKIPPHVLAFYSLSYLLLREQPDESSAVPVFLPFSKVERKLRHPPHRGKRVDTCGFYPLNSRFPLFLSLAQTRDRRPLRNRGTAEDFFYRRGAQCAPMSKPIRSAGYRSATYVVSPPLGAAQGELPEGQEKVPWGITVSRNSLARYYR